MAYGKAGDWYLNNNESGGGGSSDFSTATVTIVNSSSDNKSLGNLIRCIEEDGFPNIESIGFGASGNSTNIAEDIVLYKGNQVVALNNTINIVSTSGNIEVSPDNSSALITGDCTITIS